MNFRLRSRSKEHNNSEHTAVPQTGLDSSSRALQKYTKRGNREKMVEDIRVSQYDDLAGDHYICNRGKNTSQLFAVRHWCVRFLPRCVSINTESEQGEIPCLRLDHHPNFRGRSSRAEERYCVSPQRGNRWSALRNVPDCISRVDTEGGKKSQPMRECHAFRQSTGAHTARIEFA